VTPPFLFVVGCGRSGTTLLRAMLDSHSELAIPGESHFLMPMAEDCRRYEQNGELSVDLFVTDLLASERFLYWDLSEEDVRAALAAREPRDFPGAVRAVYAFYAARNGKPRYGDKTPNHVLAIPLFASVFPEARFLHLIRDGRDVALSLVDVPHWGPNDVATAALRWKQFVEAGRLAAGALDPSRYREVRYEELLEEPEETLRDVCGFVGLDFEAGMLDYHKRVDALLQTVSSPEIHQRLSLRPTKGLRDWRTQMTADDQGAFERVAGDLLAELGYEPRS
jgi:hypothetical protein